MSFLKQGETRCLLARKEATNALVDIDDLEVLQQPERYEMNFSITIILCLFVFLQSFTQCSQW